MKKHWKAFDYILIAVMAALGIAVKVIVVPLAQIVTGPFFIPGGVVAGGFYMLFLVIGACLTGKRWTATLIALVQAVLVTVTGTLGSHGAVSLLTYTLPGLGIDVVYLLLREKRFTNLGCFLAGMVANIIGSMAVNFAIFNLSTVPMLLSLVVAAFTGGLGGLIAYAVTKKIRKLQILQS